MSIFKCKMCGGTIEFEPGATVGVCDSCGTKQTLPKLDDDRRANLYDRANHFRRNNEFDKAAGIYERILTEDTSDAEAYWSLVLCRYGIEYVEDPASHRRVPTVNRAQYTSVFDDDNYKSALHYADSLQRILYEQEAAEINEIQKGILAISQKEKPFDVFICYKETDQQGRRTQDSVLANDLYHQLTQEGFKVFFSRITLEDKLGTAYEPYIFAALNSARVMVVLGTRPEHFNAVWVKNEWSRYLALVRDSGGKKVLIPAYRDMDPYDLPEEFSHLQAQDMSKLGFMQDLIRGIKKLLDADKPQSAARETVVVQNETNSNVTALLKRGNMALEDREWEKADDFFEQVLNLDAECAEAYLGKLLAKEKRATLDAYVGKFSARPDVKSETLYACEEGTQRINDAVERYTIPSLLDASGIKELYEFDRSYQSFVQPLDNKKKFILQSIRSEKLYQRAVSFAKGTTAEQIDDACHSIEEALDEVIRQEESRDQANVERIKSEYVRHLDSADKKAAELYEEAIQKREESYQDALRQQEEAKSSDEYRNASKRYQHPWLVGYKDCEERAEQCVRLSEQAKIQEEEEHRQKVEAERQRIAAKKAEQKRIIKRFSKIISTVVVVVVVCFIAVTKVIIPMNYYNRADAAEKAGEKQKAVELYLSASGFRDARERICNLLMQSHISTSISTGNVHTVGVRSDGSVVAVGRNLYEQFDTSEWKDIVAVSAGQAHTVGLCSNGTVVAVGRNGDGQCDVDKWKDIVAVSAADVHTVGLRSDGSVVAVGSNSLGRCDVNKWKNIVAVSAGHFHTVGLRSDGTVAAVGENGYGQCDVSEWKDIAAVSAGWGHTVGLRSDGTVVAVGYNKFGQCNVSEWKDIVAVSAGDDYTVGLRADGTVVAVGDNEYGQCDVSGWTDIVAVSAGNFHTVGLRSDGTVVAVGDNDDGQCDVSEWKGIKVPNR